MNKLSLIVASILVSQTFAIAEDIKNDWSLKGNIRAAYISDDSDAKGSAGDEIHDLAVGGSITILTPKIDNNFQAGATLNTVQPLFGQKTNGFLTDTDYNSYSYISEAYITGKILPKTSVILGKKIINTPFANPDDVGMAKNSFEVYLVQNNDIENITFTAGRVLKWAGHDAPSRGEFTDLTSGDGVSVMAVNYGDSDLGVVAQAWYYHLDNSGIVDLGIAYTDATYTMNIDEKTSLSVSGQFALFQETNSGTSADPKDGSVIGGTAAVNYDALNVGIAFNSASGDVAPTNGFGGGPFYTSADLLTIADSGQDSTAIRFSGGYNINSQISVSGGYGIFTPDEGDDLTEIDFGASYSHSNNLAFNLYVEQWTNMSEVETFEYSLFMNYSF